VQYRWHPWYGQQVCVQVEARRGGRAVLRCVRDELNGSPALEIPEWMFDPVICGQMRQESLAYVNSAALVALKSLMSAARDPVEPTVTPRESRFEQVHWLSFDHDSNLVKTPFSGNLER